MYKTEDIRKDTYPYNQSFLDKYPFMLTSFKSDNLPMIVLDNEEIDLIFDLATHFYRKLRRLKVLEDMKWGIISLTKDVVDYVLIAANIGAQFYPSNRTDCKSYDLFIAIRIRNNPYPY